MKNTINKKDILKAVIAIALPTMLEQIMSVLMQYVDTAMVGNLGAQATAAVSTSTTITWLIGSVPSAFSVATMTLIAQALGAGEHDEIKKIAKLSLYISVIIGAVIEVACLIVCPYIAGWMGAEMAIREAATRYFFWISIAVLLRSVYIILAAAIRATKDTKTPMYIGIGMNIANVVLDYIFIYIMGLGVDGAAYATCLSGILGAIAMIAAFFNNTWLRFGTTSVFHEKNIISRFFKISYPVLIINTASCFGYVVFAGLVSHMGTIIFAAHSIALGAEELFYIGGYGFKSASNTMVGISYGEKDYDKYHAVCISNIMCTLVIMIISGILLFVFAEPLMGFFTKDPEVIRLGTQVLKMVAFNEPFFGMYIVTEGIYYGLGHTKYPLIVEFSGMWIVRIISTFIGIRYFGIGLVGVWCCMIADNVYKAIMFTIPMRRLWQKAEEKKGL